MLAGAVHLNQTVWPSSGGPSPVSTVAPTVVPGTETGSVGPTSCALAKLSLAGAASALAGRSRPRARAADAAAISVGNPFEAMTEDTVAGWATFDCPEVQ
jgi:hypothetical protein